MNKYFLLTDIKQGKGFEIHLKSQGYDSLREMRNDPDVLESILTHEKYGWNWKFGKMIEIK